jgi:hypothetical protein
MLKVLKLPIFSCISGPDHTRQGLEPSGTTGPHWRFSDPTIYTAGCSSVDGRNFQICKEEVGELLRKPISNFWYFETVVTVPTHPTNFFGLTTPPSPPTITCKKKIPPHNNTPTTPTKRLTKTPWSHLPTRKEGLITRRTARRPGVRHQNVLKPHQVGT